MLIFEVGIGEGVLGIGRVPEGHMSRTEVGSEGGL